MRVIGNGNYGHKKLRSQPTILEQAASKTENQAIGSPCKTPNPDDLPLTNVDPACALVCPPGLGPLADEPQFLAIFLSLQVHGGGITHLDEIQITYRCLAVCYIASCFQIQL